MAIEMRPGFIALKRTLGRMSWIRADEITAILEASPEKKDGVEVNGLTIQIRNNVNITVDITFDDLRRKIEEATATRMHVIPWVDKATEPESVAAE